MAYDITIERVAPYGRQSTVVQWSPGENIRSAGSLNFSVYMSGNPGGPWELLAENLVDTLVYEDVEHKTYSGLKDRYYKVTANDGTFESKPHPIVGHINKQKYLISRKIFNDELIMLSKGNGIRMAVIKRKHWGERCSCVDPATKVVVKPNCEICQGTKIIQGYFKPMYVWGHVQPSSLGTDVTPPTSVPEIETTQAMLLSFPIVFKDDILVEMDTNKRWLVVSSKNTELVRNPVHQDIVMSRLPVDDAAYNLEVEQCSHHSL